MAQMRVDNIVAFNAKLNEFRSSGKYCDLRVQVEDKVFRCHRVALATASTYFDTIFGASDETDYSSLIELPSQFGVNASIFEEVVLRFVYTGDLIIDRHNVVDALRASAIFHLAGVEERCLNFIRQNSNVANVLDIFKSAPIVATKKDLWLDVSSRYVMEHFDELYGNEQLMELTSADFNALTSHWLFLSPSNENLFLDTINRRSDRGRYGKRRKHSDEDLDERIDFSNISSDYMECLFEKFIILRTSLSSAARNARPDAIADERYDIKFRPTPPAALHMYVLAEDQTIRVYSTDKTTREWNESRSSPAMKLHAKCFNYSIASIGLDDRIYSLEYSSSKTKNTFRARTRVDVLTTDDGVLSLKCPPVRMDSFDMSNVGRNIFVNNSCCSEAFTPQNVEGATFTDEKLSQGIFVYDIDANKWLPVPLLDTNKLDGSALTSDNTVLYLVEGNMHPTSVTTRESNVNIHALDYRISKWSTLTKNFPKCGSTMLGCAHEGNVYVCRGFGERYDPTVVGTFDVRAQKWENFQKMNYNYQIHQLLSYENLLWAFGKSEHNDLCDVETFETCSREWSPSPISKVSCTTENGSKNFFFKNAFIF